MPDNTQNLNRYAYCLNSPLMYTDPTGEQVLGYNPYFIGTFGISHGCGGPRDEPWNYYWLGKNEFGDFWDYWFDMDDDLWGYFDLMDYFVSGSGGGSRDLGGGCGVSSWEDGDASPKGGFDIQKAVDFLEKKCRTFLHQILCKIR